MTTLDHLLSMKGKDYNNFNWFINYLLHSSNKCTSGWVGEWGNVWVPGGPALTRCTVLSLNGWPNYPYFNSVETNSQSINRRRFITIGTRFNHSYLLILRRCPQGIWESYWTFSSEFYYYNFSESNVLWMLLCPQAFNSVYVLARAWQRTNWGTVHKLQTPI